MNKESMETLFSSSRSDWETPPELFSKLDSEFKFTLDVCASDTNAKCKEYLTADVGGLMQDWGGQVCWMNPPYGKDISIWLKKAYDESRKPDTTVVCLIPSRTDTKYWHNFVMQAVEIRFIKGRVRFVGAVSSAPFPSAIVVFKNVKRAFNLPKVSAYTYQ